MTEGWIQDETVTPFHSDIRPDPQRPDALVVADDRGNTILLFRAFNWESPTETFTCAVRFRAIAIQFGYPNNEGLGGHRLYARGLGPDGMFEVERSTWLRTIGAAGKHGSELEVRHFIVTFHEATFEVLSRSIDVANLESSPRDAAREMMAVRTAGS